MNDKNLITQIQNDIAKSNPKIINNHDNMSVIQKKFSSKYTEDISDSDDDLSSYKNRNLNMINQLSNKKNKDVDKIKNDKAKSKKMTKNIQEELDEMVEELDNNNNNNKNNNKNKKSNKKSNKDDSESDSELPNPDSDIEQKNSD